jgi:hypothetical protein
MITSPSHRLLYLLSLLVWLLALAIGFIQWKQDLLLPLVGIEKRLGSAPDRFTLLNSWDEKMYWVYLPGLIIHRDLTLMAPINSWDMESIDPGLRSEAFGGPDHHKAAFLRNKYPIGVALTLAPAFIFAHLATEICWQITGSPYFLPDGYSVLYQLVCSLFVAILAALGGVLVLRILQEHLLIKRSSSYLALIYLVAASPMLYYLMFAQFMSHAVGAFWVSLFLYSVCRAASSVPWRWLEISFFALSMAVICRPTNAVIGIVYFSVPSFWSQLKSVRWPALLLAALPVILQSLLWRLRYGKWIAYSYGQERFDWLHPHLFDSLFSSNHGLFLWSPSLLISFLGLLLSRAAYGGFTIHFRSLLVLSLLLLWYCNSSWWCWWFGQSFGGRAYMDLFSVFVIGMAVIVNHLGSHKGAIQRWGIVAGLAACGVWNLTLMALYVLNRIPRDDYIW